MAGVAAMIEDHEHAMDLLFLELEYEQQHREPLEPDAGETDGADA
jgi:hypothetical protein